MRTLQDVRISWQTLTSFHNLNDLKQALRDDERATLTNIRSICWKIFLLFQNTDQSSWLQTLVDSRSAYDSLRAHFLRAIDNPDEIDSDIDPLSEHEESPWDALRNDEAIRNEIFQDVERCMPEIIYFRQPTTQKMLLDILFIYCKLNPDVSYRQGMHELLAPILWVVERDTVDEDVKHSEADELLSIIVSSQHIEHDTFTLFALIMQTAKSFYEPAVVNWHNRSKATLSDHKDNQQESPVLQRCHRIFNNLLPKADPELADHLHSMEIAPQIFLMRWLRLLFGREFQFDELLQVWDLIFMEDPSLELVDYMSIAMLLRIRWQLIAANANDVLTLLFRYPSPSPMHPPKTFIEDAILLKSNCSVETGHQLILKYSGRSPRPMIATVERGSTSQHIRKESTSRSPSFRSPFGSPASSTLESVFQDAARNMLNRGERWGAFGQAMRDAVGEVRKNMQTLQSGRSSPLPRSLPGISGTQTHRSKRSDASSTIAANVLRRINALEERNKQLAKMLEVAVSDLWSYQKSLAEREMTDDTKSLEALNVAVAKVQFVQVYLSDSSLLLPEDQGQNIYRQHVGSGTSTPGESAAEKSSDSKEEQDLDLEQNSHVATAAPTSAIGTIGQNISDDSTQSDSVDNPHNSISVPANRLPVTSTLSKVIPNSKTPSSTTHRPTLNQSSFSYMLGQAHSDPSSSFLHATPFSPNERRSRGGADKAFLFGDEDDVGSDDSKSKGIPRAKGIGKIKGTAVREDIGLGELGNGGGTRIDHNLDS